MNPQVREALRRLGAEISVEMLQGTQRIFAGRYRGVGRSTVITRDLAYGAHERNRLDLFTTDLHGGAPVLLFVHGGGFIMGDKRLPGLPFYDNVGDFAAACGFVGATMTYRLAPGHPWPAGAEDVASAVRWLDANVASHGGDPRRIFLVGQSAGAVHVADYVAHSRLHMPAGAGIAGALMISGSYDVAQAEANPFHLAYYGEAREEWAKCSPLRGLVAGSLPLAFSVSEFDAPEFHKQAAGLAAAYTLHQGRFPRMHWLAGHNHLSPVLALGTPDDILGPLIVDFVETAGR